MNLDFNSFRILETVQESRRFVIHKAEHIQSAKRVAIKALAPAARQDNALINSLIAEAKASQKLQHPAIRRSIDSLQDGESLYLIAEYAEGISLGRYLLDYPNGVQQDLALLWAKSLAEALAYAAQQGVKHLNLNPYNIIIDPAEGLKIIGFGKARPAWKHSEGNIKYHYPILYTAPEVLRGLSIQNSSDLYSWAVVVYQIFSGNLPWRIGSFLSPEEQKEQCLTRAVIQPDEKLIPSWLFGILLDCLKIDPTERIPEPAILSLALRLEGNYVDYLELSEIAAQESVLAAEIVPEALGTQITAEIDIQAEPEAEPEPVVIEELSFAPEPEPVVIEELSFAPEPEPVVIEELSFAPEPEEILEPIILPEAPATEPVPEPEAVPVATEPIPTPPKQLQPEPEPKPIPQGSKPIPPASIALKSIPNAPKEDKIEISIPRSRPEDLSHIQSRFKMLMVISLLIVAFLGLRYFIARKPESGKPIRIEDKDDISQDGGSVLYENIAIPMQRVAADTLIMGSIAPEAEDDEFPLLSVPLKAFYIGVTELTQAEWQMVYDSNPSQFRGDNLPVENVSFYDVIDYCNAKSLKDGFTPAYDIYGSEIVCNFEADGYRLPTEAEWEMAAKAGKGRSVELYSGSDNPDDIAWYQANAGAKTRAVGSKKPNKLGVFDLSGNVYEWTWNWYAPYSHKVPNLSSGPNSGTDKVIRGGSWFHGSPALRISKRAYMKPFHKNPYTGFRVVRSAI